MQTRPPARHSFESPCVLAPAVTYHTKHRQVSRVRGVAQHFCNIDTALTSFCGELGDESPAEVIGVAKLEVTVKDIAMKQS